jgi:disulfide bond formation protein DsbB
VSRLTGDPVGLWAAIRPLAVPVAAAVATTATLGSLYLSEVAGYDPCRLCWVQRAFMYPAAVLLIIAAVTRRTALALVGGGLALIGLPIAVFHRYDQAVGGVGDFCDAANPCALIWVEEFGFVTIPTMAAAGFFAVVVFVALHALDARNSLRSTSTTPSTSPATVGEPSDDPASSTRS